MAAVIRTREEWQRLLTEQAASGQTIRTFCQAKGVGQSSFARWKERLTKAGPSGDPKRSPFVPVAVTPRGDITVAVRSVAVTLSSAVSPQWLASFVKHLQG